MVVLTFAIPLIGAFLTFELARHFTTSIVRLASVVTLLFSGLCYVLLDPHSLLFEHVLTLFYAGVFVGMSSHHRLGRKELLLAGITLGLLFSVLYRQIDLLGGALGFMAFSAVLFAKAIKLMRGKTRARINLNKQ